MNGTIFAMTRRQDNEDEKKRWEMLVMLGRERARLEEDLRQLRSADEPVEVKPRCCRVVNRWAS